MAKLNTLFMVGAIIASGCLMAPDQSDAPLSLTVTAATMAWDNCPGLIPSGTRTSYTWDYSTACYALRVLIHNPTDRTFYGGTPMKIRWVGSSEDGKYGGSSSDNVPTLGPKESREVKVHLEVDETRIPVRSVAIFPLEVGLSTAAPLGEGAVPWTFIPPRVPSDNARNLRFIYATAAEHRQGLEVHVYGSNGTQAVWFTADARIEVYNRTLRCDGPNCGVRETLLLTHRRSISLTDFVPDERDRAPTVVLRYNLSSPSDAGYHAAVYVKPNLRSCEYGADAYTRRMPSGVERDSSMCRPIGAAG